MSKNAIAKGYTMIQWPDNTRRSYSEPSSIYRNLNNEVGYCLQSNTTGGGVQDSPTTRAEVAKADWCILQWKWLSAQSAEATYLSQIKAIRDVKLAMYAEPRFFHDVAETTSDSTEHSTYLAMTNNSPPTIWRAQDSANNWLAHTWGSSDTKALNLASTATNGLGERISQALVREWKAYFSNWNLYDGIMLDDCNIWPKNLTVRGNGTETNWDYDDNGTNNDIYGGDPTFATAWRAGIAQLVTDARDGFGKKICINTDHAYWYIQSSGVPPRPLSTTTWYQLQDFGMHENGFWAQAGFGDPDRSDHVYPLKGWMNVNSMLVGFEMYKNSVKPTASNPWGRQISSVQQQLAVSTNSAADPIDYDFARFCWGFGRLVDGIGYGCVRNGAARPFFLDETCINLGAVVGSRNMGTINEATSPVSFNRRSPNATNGSAEFYWQEYENALVVGRLDTTGLTPGSSNFGDGSSSTYTLPAAGSGKKWQRPNAATYVHPSFADLAMLGQNTTLNNGADATTSSLKPLHFEVFLRVNS